MKQETYEVSRVATREDNVYTVHYPESLDRDNDGHSTLVQSSVPVNRLPVDSNWGHLNMKH